MRSQHFHLDALSSLVHAVAVSVFVATGWPSQPAFGQSPRTAGDPDTFLNRQRAIDEAVRREFDEQLGAPAKSAFDWGGWCSLNLFAFDDGVESSRTFRRHDLRLWGRLTLDRGAHELYARTRLSLIDFNAGDSYDGNEDDIEGPNLERGYYRFNLAKALRLSGDPDIDGNLIASAGRDLVQFGTGLTLSAPLDHVWIRATRNELQLTVLAAKSIGSTRDFDLSRTATRTRRNFLGGELRYVGFERHEPFAYVLWQRDRNIEAVYQPFQRYDYDSFYAGFGSTGELTDNLRYAAEGVLETGRSVGNRRFLRSNDVGAYAFRAELEYLFRGPKRARTSVEYVFGSGDPDRFGSPTNSRGGNTTDFDDRSFIGFGYVDTGLALAPRYANLHLWRAGTSWYPWPASERLRNLQLGTDWFLFHKHHGSGAVSDPTADVQSGYLGWEMDYYANWRVTSDFAWTTRFGVFFPGSAFDDQTTRTFLLVGMTWSF